MDERSKRQLFTYPIFVCVVSLSTWPGLKKTLTICGQWSDLTLNMATKRRDNKNQQNRNFGISKSVKAEEARSPWFMKTVTTNHTILRSKMLYCVRPKLSNTCPRKKTKTFTWSQRPTYQHVRRLILVLYVHIFFLSGFLEIIMWSTFFMRFFHGN